MDPNETLMCMRECAEEVWVLTAGIVDESFEHSTDRQLAQRQAELFEALDQWLLKGGFLPADWKRK